MLPGSQITSLDFEDAYLLVLIHPEHKKFLCFQRKEKTFQFSALPFRLATAPYILYKIITFPLLPSEFRVMNQSFI